jgi:NTP pyrophosphatase (non-canonical NTP hydrolase)
MDFATYIKKATATESVIDSVSVDYDQFLHVLNATIGAGNLLDVAKKDIFYGLPKNEAKLTARQQRLDDNSNLAFRAASAARNNIHYAGNRHGTDPINLSKINPRVAHAVIGLATESIELLEALKLAIESDQPIDEVNVLEELGDLAWYLAIAVDSLNGNWDTILEANIAKLAKRNQGNTFNADATINRDVVAERQLLETHLST